jgi:hypothetical protein
MISAQPGTNYFAILIARGSTIRSDLTVGGGGPGGSDDGIAIAVLDGSHDARLQRLRLRDGRGDGLNVWGPRRRWRRSRAGVALGSDVSRDTSVIRTRVRGFRD